MKIFGWALSRHLIYDCLFFVCMCDIYRYNINWKKGNFKLMQIYANGMQKIAQWNP